jgi:hypothetical protein
MQKFYEDVRVPDEIYPWQGECIDWVHIASRTVTANIGKQYLESCTTPPYRTSTKACVASTT